MPQWRKLHTKITESWDVNDMPNDFYRLLWLLLPLALDREGIGVDNPGWIKSKTMPLRDDISGQEIDTAMTWYEDRGMLIRYQVDDRPYFYVPTFQKYQGNTSREAESIFPLPPDELMSSSRVGHDQLEKESRLDVDVDVDSDSEEMQKRGDAEVDAKNRDIDIPQTPKQAGEHPDIIIFQEATGRIPGIKQYRTVIETIQYIKDSCPAGTDVITYLKPFWLAWRSRRSKDGREYDKTNLAWLTEWAVNNHIPPRYRTPESSDETWKEGYSSA